MNKLFEMPLWALVSIFFLWRRQGNRTYMTDELLAMLEEVEAFLPPEPSSWLDRFIYQRLARYIEQRKNFLYMLHGTMFVKACGVVKEDEN